MYKNWQFHHHEMAINPVFRNHIPTNTYTKIHFCICILKKNV